VSFSLLQALSKLKEVIKKQEWPRLSKLLQKDRAAMELEPLDAAELDAEVSRRLAADAAFQSVSEVRVVVREGKHRMVRRMLHNAGHTVLALHRVRYGELRLGEDLPEGGVRAISADELAWFKDWATAYDAVNKSRMEEAYSEEEERMRVKLGTAGTTKNPKKLDLKMKDPKKKDVKNKDDKNKDVKVKMKDRDNKNFRRKS
jgi:phage anti-repressor protein